MSYAALMTSHSNMMISINAIRRANQERFFRELNSVFPAIAIPSFAVHTRSGTRAHNLFLRRAALYPLGHTGAEA
jgi:hypothetical protein